jgi:hypothetical protein
MTISPSTIHHPPSTTTLVQPQHLVHRGGVEAAGFFFDTRLLPPEEAGRRILALWTPDAAVFRVADGLLLRLSSSHLVRCDEAPGLPLTSSTDGLLLSAPLTPDEMRRLDAPPGALVLIVGGIAVVYDLASVVQEDPAVWLDVAGWHGRRTTSLGAPPMAPRLVAEPEPFDPRARMPGVPPAAPDRVFIMEALRKAAAGESAPSSEVKGDGAAGSGPSTTVGKQLTGWLRRLIGTGDPGKVMPAESRQTQGDLGHRIALRLLRASGVAAVIGKRQAEYIGRMLEMFERGDLHEALRHAIPMGALEGKPKPAALGVPTARPDLTITLQKRPSNSALHLAPELHNHITSLYRQAVTRLEAEGRIDEAAFVLAELLGLDHEAVSLLERHKRYRLAAELAEARKLPPAQVVRLWFLAGDRERTALIARRTGTFAAAVLLLERTHRERAGELRMLWATALAAAGDYAGAMQAIEPILTALWQNPEMRERVGAWLDEAVTVGGPAGARMLARKIALFPDRQEELRMQALAILADDNADTVLERVALADALRCEEATPLTKTLARAAARSVLRDAGAGYVRLGQKDWQRLLMFAGDALLRADAPALPPVAGPARRETPFTLRIAAADAGIVPIYDAALLPDGRCLLALGEAGMRLVTRDGKTIMHVEQPAHRLAVSDHGNQVIALAPRGELWRMARMNLITRKAEVWREAALRSFAPNHDGSLWFVSIDKDLLAIDVAASGFDALWRLPNPKGSVLAIARAEARCSCLLFSAGVTDAWDRPTELWTRLEVLIHSLPNLFLRERKEVFNPPPTAQEGIDYARAILPEGDLYYLMAEPSKDRPDRWELVLRDPKVGNRLVGVAEDRPQLLPPILSAEWIVLITRQADGIHCRALARKALQLHAEVSLDGATGVSARITGSYLTIADDRGRLLVIDLDRGELLRNQRVN